MNLKTNWSDLFDVIDKRYPDIETIVKYLENENKIKTDLNVEAPTQNLSKDVAEYK